MKNRLALIISGLLLLVLAALEVTKPKPIKWDFDLTATDKSPLGCKVLYDLLYTVFPIEELTVAGFSPYTMTENELEDEISGHAVYFILTEDFAPDSLDAARLLQFAEKGHTVFVSASWFSGFFADTLQLNTETNYLQSDSLIGLHITDPSSNNTSVYMFRTDLQADQYFENADSLGFYVLGQNTYDEATFIYRSWGLGHIFLSSVPAAFTNYYLVQEQHHRYASSVLSYLPYGQLIWDEYYKPKQKLYGNLSDTPLRYLLSVEALKWALYISIISVLLFMLFEARRKQKAIPVIKPLANTTLEFTKTVGMLYFQNGDHKDLAIKKINHFLHFLRTKLFIKNIEMNDNGYRHLSEKTGIDYKEIVRLFIGIQQAQTEQTVSEEQLLVLSRNIDRFYRQVNK